MSVDDSINRFTRAAYGRACDDLTSQERRGLVKRLRLDGLHAEADSVWERVLRDSIEELTLVG